MLVDDDLAALRRRFAGTGRWSSTWWSRPLGGLAGVVGVTVEAQGMRQRLEFTGSAAGLIAEVARRVEIRDVTVDGPSIEDLVRTLYAS